MTNKETEQKQKLMEYLSTVSELEKEKYTQENLIKKLRGQVRKLGIAKEIQKPMEVFPDTSYKRNAVGIGFSIAALSVLVGGFVAPGPFWIKLLVGIGIGVGAAILAAVLGCVASKSKAKKINDARAKEYADAVYRDMERCEKEEEEKKLLVEDINTVKATLKETTSTLEQLYELNVVYNKYWDPVPIATFYEYLKSGRCDTLGGYEGAYNRYEDELKMDRIVGRLDIVIQKLDQVVKNQYYLACSMREANKNIERLYDASISMAASLQSIEKNEALNAYNTAVIAQNQRAMHDMVSHQYFVEDINRKW